MPRQTPTINADTLGRYDAHPVKDVAEYFLSQQNDHLFMKPPCVDTPGEDIESFYIDKKTEHNLLLKYFARLCDEQSEQKKIFTNRIRIMLKTFDDMHVSFIKLNNFIRDSDEKKKTAIKKINDEIEKQNELRANILVKKTTLDQLEIFRKELEYTTEQYRPYEAVLENAVKMSKTYESVKDLINRCDAIMFAQNEITSLDAKLFGEIEIMRKHMSEIVKQAELIALGLKNTLSSMQRLYNNARSESFRWERIYSDARKAVVSKNNNKGRALDAINGIYRMLCARRDLFPKYLRNDVEKELDFIKDEVVLLREVLNEHNHKIGRKPVTEMLPKC